jgi:hypothetical protein
MDAVISALAQAIADVESERDTLRRQQLAARLLAALDLAATKLQAVHRDPS